MNTLFTGLSVAVAASLAYWFLLRTLYFEWGATDEEVLATMAGDRLVPRPSYRTTLAVTITATPSDIWPWLVQMGDRRGGLYSYDWLDRLFGYLHAPSAEHVLPEFQRLEVGDTISIGRGGGFPVQTVEPCRTLVLGGEGAGFQWSWQLELAPTDHRAQTRLVSRNRAKVPRTIGSRLFMVILEPAAFLMTRKMLLGIKRRAESLAAARNAVEKSAA